jgi:predicted SnoaL-like aldol condensation-catalyzing enzyme
VCYFDNADTESLGGTMTKVHLIMLLALLQAACAIDPRVSKRESLETLQLSHEESAQVRRTREVRPMAEDFARLMYIERKGHEAFEKYVADDLIEHDPDFGDGRESVFEFIKERGAKLGSEYLPMDQWRVYIDQIVVQGDLAIIRTHAFQRKNDPGRVFMNFWRWKGDRIIEHWDVIMDAPVDKRNPRTVW